ncbi:MAG: DNA primase DnaG [Candidatus Pacearchaeota archaeon]
MAKISPVSIKYMIHATFRVEGALEKPDIIGAIFGQTEGLLGADLEMRELQKEGKIGRIEVEIERKDKITFGKIKIPTALDQSETTLVAAAIETIEKIGPCDAQVEVERIEDVRGTKREYIIERAKKLMAEMAGKIDSKEISKEVKEYIKTSDLNEYGDEKLPCGDLSADEIIVVEGRADVLNLLRSGVKNVIGMNGTKLPDSIKKLGEEKRLTIMVDGDRGGRLILQNVLENAKISYVCIAPDGKEVEELTSKEVLQLLRKKVPVEDFLEKERRFKEDYRTGIQTDSGSFGYKGFDHEVIKNLRTIAEGNKELGKVIFLDKNMNEIKKVSLRSFSNTLKKLVNKPEYLIIYDFVKADIIKLAEDFGIKIILGNNFDTTETKIRLIKI